VNWWIKTGGGWGKKKKQEDKITGKCGRNGFFCKGLLNSGLEKREKKNEKKKDVRTEKQIKGNDGKSKKKKAVSSFQKKS